MKFFEELACEALKDPYFIELLVKLETVSAQQFFRLSKLSLSEKEITDALRFADILSRSENPEAKNKAYKIISLLSDSHQQNETYASFAKPVLIRLGNFPALRFIEHQIGTDVVSPREVVFEKIIKETFHAIPNSDYTFTDAQYKIYESLKRNNHFSFSGPTSIGKSFIIKAFIHHIISESKGTDNIALLVPTRALINQAESQIKTEFSQYKQYKVLTHPIVPKAFNIESNKFIFVFTPERLISYLSDVTNPKIDYLFIDEAHKIVSEKDTRSPLYYHAVLQAERKSVKLYFASPNIPNPDVFLRLFEKSSDEALCIKSSPVSQNRYFLDLVKRQGLLLSDTENEINLNIEFENNELNHWIKRLSNGEKSIVYCNSKSDTIELALEFAATLPNKTNKEVDEVISLIEQHLHKKYYLIDCLRKGVAFHFGNLPQRIRERVESLFESRKIDYIFCTSTLLEGVNLPAKNIFILSNAIGLTKFTDIDFWNLCGRAGRLTKELSGNIICTRAQVKKNRWDNPDADLKVVRQKQIKKLEPQIITGKGNFYKNVESALTGASFTVKNPPSNQVNIWKHYANIALIHEIRGDDSVLRSSFVSKITTAQATLKSKSTQIVVPEKILEACSGIKAEYQNQIYINSKSNKSALPTNITYDTALIALNLLSTAYKWPNEESSGKSPLYTSPDTLKYYAVLIEGWANTKPLHLMIQNALSYYEKKGQIWVVDKWVTFDKNSKKLLNLVINNLISDIDNFIRFKIRSYFENYNMLLKSSLGAGAAGSNWAEFLEYGTTDSRVIELQNYGIPRHLAQFLIENHESAMNFSDASIVPFEKKKILLLMDTNSEEYREPSELELYN
ncbi:DEAD/DEAH box helicase [Pseudomonas syringae]|uniref:DEAD/DEAH box helicase n=1 Tax=Pseudomonas syringae TaxID=317 RepID=UPI002364C2F9|nr:DEAD/DEAH box helicase [Pseudomonas syringae]GKQ48205.1 DEAD/DEAH box helicase [Pseudomonas syringae pv. theae]